MAEVGFLTSAASALLELLDTRLTSVSKRVRKGTPGLPVGSWDEAREAVRSAERGHVGDLSLMELEGALRGMALLAGFEELEARLFAFALLPGLDERLGRAVGLVHDDLSRTRISVGLAARALGSLEGRRAVLLAAGPAGRLVGSGLCQLVGAYGDALAPRASQELSPHPRALDALLWGEPLPLPDPALGAAFLVEPPWPTGGAPSRFGSGVDPSAAMSGGAAGLVIASPQIDAAIEVASHFAGVDGLRLVRVDIAVATELGISYEDLASVVRREAILLGALPVWTGLPEREILADHAGGRRLANLLTRAPRPLVLHAAHPWMPPPDVPLTLVNLMPEEPPAAGRAAAWQENGNTWRVPGDAEALELAQAFSLSRDAIRAARREAEAEDAVLPANPAARLHRTARRHAASQLVQFATRVTPRAKWNQVVLPTPVLAQLREIEWRVRRRTTVFQEAGFDRTASARKGFVALFAGPSGTGKTLSAELVTGQGYLYRVDLASLVSKYIGETEKHLSRVFADAESMGGTGILFFDEADAIFGKRSEVRDAHDRYANLEVNYLLQRIESFAGVVILATNLRQNIDDSFLRRLDMVVEFPFPDEAARSEIWRRVWPREIQMDGDLDWSDIGRRFSLSGGSIRNCAVDATFRSAARGNGTRLRVTRGDVLLSLGREYQKQGRPVIRSEFGDAYDAVMEGTFGTEQLADLHQ